MDNNNNNNNTLDTNTAAGQQRLSAALAATHPRCVSALISALVEHGALDEDTLEALTGGVDWDEVADVILETAGVIAGEDGAFFRIDGYDAEIAASQVEWTQSSVRISDADGYEATDALTHVDGAILTHGDGDGHVLTVPITSLEMLGDVEAAAADLDVEVCEVFEHWSVSPRLACALRAEEEAVVEVMGLSVWCRCTTGQALYMDGTMMRALFAMGA